MFERFTDRARRVVVLAQEEARLLNHGYIDTEHILLGLVHEGEGVAVKVIESMSLTLQGVRDKVEEVVGSGGDIPPEGHIPFTPRAKKVFELSLREALQLGHNYIGTEHILLGLLRERQGAAAQVLVALGLDHKLVRGRLIELLSGSDRPPETIAETVPLFRHEPWLVDHQPDRWLEDRRGLSQQSRIILEQALGEAVAANADEIEPEHLILALLGDTSATLSDLLHDVGIDPHELRRRLQPRSDDDDDDAGSI